jgi:hypothetical protein
MPLNRFIPLRLPCVVAAATIFAALAPGQRLYWKLKEDQGSYRCVYGEIQVLATAPNTNYSSFSWWIQCPARGDIAIQDNGARHTIVFSVWDTSAEMPSLAVDQGDQRAEISRFEGTVGGAKTVVPYHWEVGQLFRYFLLRRPDAVHKATLTSCYFFDEAQGQWVYASTVASPENGDKAVKGFGGTTAASLDNMGGKNNDLSKLAVYRVWAGTNLDDLTSVNSATGEGIYGAFDNSFFIAGGDEKTVKGLINGYVESGGVPTYGAGGLVTVSPRKMPVDILKSLRKLLTPGK